MKFRVRDGTQPGQASTGPFFACFDRHIFQRYVPAPLVLLAFFFLLFNQLPWKISDSFSERNACESLLRNKFFFNMIRMYVQYEYRNPKTRDRFVRQLFSQSISCKFKYTDGTDMHVLVLHLLIDC